RKPSSNSPSVRPASSRRSQERRRRCSTASSGVVVIGASVEPRSYLYISRAGAVLCTIFSARATISQGLHRLWTLLDGARSWEQTAPGAFGRLPLLELAGQTAAAYNCSGEWEADGMNEQDKSRFLS